MYSIIIPYYDPEYKKTQIFTDCVRSVIESSQGQDYELIIVKDGNSYVESHNKGLKAARGEWLVIINDDVTVQDNDWLQKLESDGIASWRVDRLHAFPETLPDAACFAISRETFEKLGLMDEVYKDGMNYEDTDYFLKAHKLEIPFYQKDVKLTHIGYATATNYIKEDRAAELKRINRDIFQTRWQ